MATAPFTPFYSTPYAYPSSATAAYPPPVSGSFPAPAYGPYSFPSTTTYPPPPYPGGYYTSPFPYAATYSYPPPASACTPAAGFTPAPAYGPFTYPCAAASPCLTSAATSIPTNAEPNWPPPIPESLTPRTTPSAPATATQSPASASSEFYGALSLRSSLCGQPKLLQHKEGGSGGDLTMGTNTSGTSINDKKLVDKQPGPEILSMDHAGSTHHFVPEPSPVLDLDKSNGCQPKFQQGATSDSPALHVFDGMPTPQSGYENYCCGCTNPVESSCMHGGSTNLTEQHLDGMPKQYGFHNLIRHSVLLADGSEHSYFALPEDYPLERAVPEPVFDVYADKTEDCSNVFVDVLAGTPYQQLYEEKQPATEHSSACVNISSNGCAFRLELQPQDDERTLNCTVFQASDSFVTSSNQVNFEHSMKVLRMLWDPGASLPCFSRCKCLPFWVQYKIDVLWKSEIGRATGISWDPGIQHYMVPNGIISALQDNSFIMQRTAYLFESKSTATLILAAPGSQSTCAAKQSSLLSHSGNIRTNHSVTKRFIHSIGAVTPRQIPGQRHLLEPSLPVVMLRNGSKFTNGQLAYMPRHTSSSSAVCVRHTIIVRYGWFPSFDNRAKRQWDPGIDISSYFYICPEMRAVKPFIWLLCQLFSDLQHQLQTSNKISVWDPGIVNLMDLMLGKTAMPTRVQISQTPFKLLNFIEQLFHLEHIRSQLMLQCTFWCTTQSAFLHLQYCCFPLYSELVKLLGCYSSKFSSTAVCKSTTTTLCMRVVLCSGKIAQEGRDAAAVYHIFKTQSPIDSLLFVYIWLYKHMIHLVPNDWELFNQHGVPGNYSAQHWLLFSHQYHKTREIGTFFITFLPP